MRNLKRALSLALASVMLLGMMVVGAGAAYTDEDKIANVEAAEVVSALGIMSGNTDGSFNPQGNLLRGEFTVLLAQLMNGGKFNSALYKDTKMFPDVTWAAGFVNYAASNKWISGYPDGRFGQDDPVTTAQALLIVCNALGIAVDFESGYQVGALAAADEADLLEGITNLNADAYMTRENAAQLILNAALYSESATYYEVTVAGGEPLKFDNKDDALLYAGLKDGAAYQGEKKDLSESLLATKFGVTRDTVDQTDDYGRPAIAYVNVEGSDRLEAPMVYADEPDFVFEEATTEKAAYAKMGKTVVSKFPEPVAEAAEEEEEEDAPVAVQPSKTGTGTWAPTANGTVVEVYVGEDSVDVVVIETYVAKVDSWTAANADTEAKEQITVDFLGEDPAALADAEDKYVFETEAFDEDDAKANEETIVLVTLDKNGKIATVVAAKSETVKPTKVTVDTSFVAGGKEYKYSANKELTNAVEYDEEFTVYLDKYGFVINSVAVETKSTSIYAIVEKMDLDSTALFGEDALKAQVTFVDGTKKVITVVDQEFAHGDENDYYENQLVEMTYNATKDVYTFKAVAEDTSSADITAGKANSIEGTVLNAETIFVVAQYNSDEEITGYKYVTGIRNVTSYVSANGTTASYLGNPAKVVYVENAAVASATEGEIVFVLGNENAGVVTDIKGTYVTLKAIVDGKVTTIDVEVSEEEGAIDYAVNAFVESLTVEEGLVIDYVEFTEGAIDLQAAEGIEAASKDTIKIGDTTYGYDDAAKVYEIKDGAITELDGVSAIKASETAKVVFSRDEDGVITTIYLGIDLEAEETPEEEPEEDLE